MSTIDPVIQRIQPKPRLLLRPRVKHRSNRGQFLRQRDPLAIRSIPRTARFKSPRLLRIRSIDQAALLSSDSALLRQGPLAPRALPRFSATMGLSDSRHGRLPIMYSRQTLTPEPPPCRVSQVPRCDCPSAPSPLTPGCPAGAFARFFPAGPRLHQIWLVGHTHKRNEAESGSLALGLTRLQPGSFSFPSPPPPTHGGDRPASRTRLPWYEGPLLHGLRAITMTGSSQPASRTRLCLAHQITQTHAD
jgi:hypothetical protein